MAQDEKENQFDTQRAKGRHLAIMKEMVWIRDELTEKIKDVYEYPPTSESDERDRRDKIRRDLNNVMRVTNNLIRGL